MNGKSGGEKARLIADYAKRRKQALEDKKKRKTGGDNDA
jgi:hypothetical protein